MPTDGDAPRRRRSLDKGRMESFSDGVFGFAATLLVADLALGRGSSALQQVLHAWPGYLAYITSFLTIGAAWLVHTGLTVYLIVPFREVARLYPGVNSPRQKRTLHALLR